MLLQCTFRESLSGPKHTGYIHAWLNETISDEKSGKDELIPICICSCKDTGQFYRVQPELITLKPPIVRNQTKMQYTIISEPAPK